MSAGPVCLQGGAEFSPGCREMDSHLLALAPGPVVVTALAGAPGWEYATATRNGVEHWRGLGADDVRGAPDVRQEPDAALAVLRRAGVLVLPGGSPSRLRAALEDTPVGALVRELSRNGALLVGSSAGAMLLAAATVLPDGPRGPSGQLPTVPGLDLVPGVLVVPHWTGARGREGWLRAAEQAGVTPVGIPEESGVLVRDGSLTALGQAATVLPDGRRLPPGTTSALL